MSFGFSLVTRETQTHLQQLPSNLQLESRYTFVRLEIRLDGRGVSLDLAPFLLLGRCCFVRRLLSTDGSSTRCIRRWWCGNVLEGIAELPGLIKRRGREVDAKGALDL